MTDSRRIGLWVTLAAALAYCVWLGAHWLPLSYSDKELSASASRVWDIKTELRDHHQLPWWTPNFMSGSSYAINHTRGFYLLPWIAFSTFTDLESAGKLIALLAIFASGLAMYGCARHFLRHDWAAALAAIAYMLHPEQLIRAAGAEHITISLFFPFIPLLWWTFARMLESGKLRDIVLCALTAVFAMWTDNKQAVLNFLYLAFYLVYWLWPKERRRNLAATGRTLGLLTACGLAIGAVIIVPGLIEAKYIKLFVGDPLAEWQKNYSFHSLFGLVDRNGAVTRDITASLMTKLQTRQVGTQAELDAVRRIFGMQMDSPEKYAGLVCFGLLAATVLWNYRRENRRLFWCFIAAFMFSVMLATGFGNVLSANLKTFDALSAWGGAALAMWLAAIALAAFLVLFARRKLTTPRKWVLAGGALLVFLLVPAFEVIAQFPYFKDIRAPYSFYDVPGAFWCAILLGFFVTDVLKSRVPLTVIGIAALLLLDYWPYQKPMKGAGVPTSTIQNLQTAYSTLAADKDWVKTYSISGRYFHLLGPMYSGKPQVYEAFYNWQAPLGLGLLHNASAGSREFLNLLGARYLVLDKTDPGMQQQKQVFTAYRQAFPVVVENEDFVILRNDTAHPYVSATTRACTVTGDLAKSAPLALTLAAKNFTLVHDVHLAAAARAYDETSPLYPPVIESAPLLLQDVRLARENHQLIRIQLTAPNDCVAVIAECYYPFWHATVDGKPVDVWRVNCALMGVELAAGPHEIVLSYRPPRAYAVAGIVSLLGFVVAVVATIRSSRSDRRQG